MVRQSNYFIAGSNGRSTDNSWSNIKASRPVKSFDGRIFFNIIIISLRTADLFPETKDEKTGGCRKLNHCSDGGVFGEVLNPKSRAIIEQRGSRCSIHVQIYL